jgi:hypothetical protein
MNALNHANQERLRYERSFDGVLTVCLRQDSAQNAVF